MRLVPDEASRRRGGPSRPRAVRYGAAEQHHGVRVTRAFPRARDRSMTAHEPIRLGVAGLGRAFMLMLPTFLGHPRVKLVAASDTRAEARRQFEAEFGGQSHATIEALCGDRQVDAVYIA